MKLPSFIQSQTILKLFVYPLFIFLIFNSCSDDSNSPIDVKFDESGTKVLVIFVENSYIVSPELNTYYPAYKSEIDKLLASIFEINIDALRPLQIDYIIETYGEEWQINQIRSVADLHYDKVIVITDESANYSSFIDSLSMLSKSFNSIDLILNTHGSNRSICFGENSVNSYTIANDLRNLEINIRAIYQTCCHGSSTIHDFENAGVYCINGAVGENFYALFSAKLFLEKWCSGATYSSAVQSAYSQEPIEIQRRIKDNPVAMYYFNFTKEQKENSRQQVGGKFNNLLFKQIKAL